MLDEAALRRLAIHDAALVSLKGHEINKLLETISSLRGNWKPIADIPPELKDGREVIVGAKGWAAAAFWDYGQSNHWEREGWYDECDRNDIGAANLIHPKYYQEMPAPPEGE